MIVTCSKCGKEIKFDRETIPWIHKTDGVARNERWLKCECGTEYCVEVKLGSKMREK